MADYKTGRAGAGRGSLNARMLSSPPVLENADASPEFAGAMRSSSAFLALDEAIVDPALVGVTGLEALVAVFPLVDVDWTARCAGMPRYKSARAMRQLDGRRIRL